MFFTIYSFLRPYRLMVRTPAFQAENPGSIPGRVMGTFKPEHASGFLVPTGSPAWNRTTGAKPIAKQSLPSRCPDKLRSSLVAGDFLHSQLLRTRRTART
jgi:hypothetical protein